jgi:lipopolysaccharide transport system permease protein
MTTVTETLRFAWSSRRAWWFTATARTRARYARTALGSLWLGLSNLLSIAALSLVYGTVFKVQHFNSYVVFLGTGLVVWNSMAAAIGAAPTLFSHNSSHLRNTNLPPIFYTLEEWAFQVQTFLQSLVLVLLALSFFQPTLLWHLLSAGLLPLLNILLFLYWFPLVLCLVGARFHDMFQLVPIILQLLFLVSPILYDRKILGNLGWTADVNPLYRVLSPFRHSLLHGEIKWNQGIFLLLFNLIGVWLGVWLLERQRRVLPFLV